MVFLLMFFSVSEPNNFCRISSDNSLFGHIFRHNRAGSDNGALSDIYSGKNNYMSANPHVISDNYCLFGSVSLFAHGDIASVKCVIAAVHSAKRSHHHIFSDNSTTCQRSIDSYSGIVTQRNMGRKDRSAFNVNVIPTLSKNQSATHTSQSFRRFAKE